MELGVELLPNFLHKAELAKLGEDRAQEVLLVDREVVLRDLEQHGLGLSEIATGYLAEQERKEEQERAQQRKN